MDGLQDVSAWLETLPRARLLSAVQAVLQAYPEAVTIVQQHTLPESAPKVPQRSFDMGKYRQRKVALQLQYEGGNYFGFAAQAQGECDETVEKQLFAALRKVCLIEDRQTSEYSRCGRTDRGVSALGQVVALKLRSAFPKDLPLEEIPVHPCDPCIHPPEGSRRSKEMQELNYCQLLNRVLPRDIRVLGWSEVSEQFSARFSSTHRTYRCCLSRQ